MKCDQCRDRLKSYIEGFLSIDEDEEIEAHLLTCQECEKVYEEEKEEYELFKEAFTFEDVVFKDNKVVIMDGIHKDLYKNKKYFFNKRKNLGIVAAVLLIGVIATPMIINIVNNGVIIGAGSSTKETSDKSVVLEEAKSRLQDGSDYGKAEDELSNSLEVVSDEYEKVIQGWNNPTPDGKYDISIEENEGAEGKISSGSLYIRNLMDDTVYKYNPMDEDNSIQYIDWYNENHLMIIQGKETEQSNLGNKIVMLNVTNGKKRIVSIAKENEKYSNIEKKGNDLEITIIVNDKQEDDTHVLKSTIFNYTIDESEEE